MKSLLITGSNGWLGKAIIRNLITNYNFYSKLDFLIFHSLDKKNYLTKGDISILKQNKIQYAHINGSLTNGTLKRSINNILLVNQIQEIKVIHTASVIHPKRVHNFNEVNFHGLVDFINSIDKEKLSKFTYISSNSPFGFNKRGYPFNENSNYNPFGGYGESKKRAEEFLLNLNYEEKITILRAPWFHGKDMPERQAKFIIKASKGKFPMIGKGENKRSLVNTSDLAIAALNVTLKKRKKQIYWVSDESSYTMRKIISIIQNSYSKNINKGDGLRAIYLPKGTSSVFCFLDLMLQKIGVYNMYLHVLGELGQNIECCSKEYWNEFKDHKPIDFEKSIDEELMEAYHRN